MQARAAFLRHGLQGHQRIKPLTRIDHGGAMRGASKIAQHHAEAMIKRHRNAKLILRRQLHRFTNEITIIQDIVVCQCRTFRCARGAGGELDIDRIIKLQLARQIAQAFMMRWRTHIQNAAEGDHAWRGAGVDLNHHL